jgi:ketosteroid isomerase-like protein
LQRLTCEGEAQLNVVSEANKRVVMQFFAHLTAGEMAAVVDLFAADGRFWGPPARLFMSKTQLLSTLEWVKARVDGNMEMRLGPVTAEGNRVVVLAESFAKLTNGKTYNNVYAFYFEIDDGKITMCREYNDGVHTAATLMAST